MVTRTFCFTLLMLLCIQTNSAQEDPWQSISVDFNHGKLQLSPNGRYLCHKDGTPFFYLADTAWELFHRLNEQEVELYLENRRAKGFTVIQAVILAELDGINTPNAYGTFALKDNEEFTPNEDYFKWIDKVIRIAESKGLYIGLLPTWGDKVDKQWGVGPELFNPEIARVYGEWLGQRYKGFKNIIWINGGDRLGGDKNFPTWDAIGKGLKKTDKNHLITFHPQGECSSSQWFNNSEWLDFNMAQTGHCQRSFEIYQRLICKDYLLEPIKPCLDGEPRYENHPVCWKPDSLGWFDDVDVRHAIYWSIFSGSLGHTYGCHDIWQMLDKGREPVGLARGNWKQSMDLPGASDLIHARRLLQQYDWQNGFPSQDLIVSENDSFEHKIVAFRGKKFAFVYFPNGETVTLNLQPLENSNPLKLHWMNPRTGELNPYTNPEFKGGYTNVIPPSSGRGNDWILVVEQSDK